MIGLYKSDAIRAGGFSKEDLTRTAYGGEDINFSARVRRVVKVYRPYNPNIVHMYHRCVFL